MEYDLSIEWVDNHRSLNLIMTEQKISIHGQHGIKMVFQDTNNQKWVLKLFTHIIDKKTQAIPDQDVDIKGSPEVMKQYLHLWRAMNEYAASKIAMTIKVNVPEVILITSAKISSYNLRPKSSLPLEENVIILDTNNYKTETAEQTYHLSEREKYTITTSEAFEKFLALQTEEHDPSLVIGALIKFIPNSLNLDNYFDFEKDFDKAVDYIKNQDVGYKLLPFDVWLNDPDRNQGNYVVQMDDNKVPISIYGIDYEMWSFGDDLWMDKDTTALGRSYLAAVIHKATNAFDSRIMGTIFQISSITDKELQLLTLAPKLICQFVEYHIKEKNLHPDERMKILNIEQNMWDFLYETRPRLEKLTIRIIKQIGLPLEYKDLEKKLLTLKKDDEE